MEAVLYLVALALWIGTDLARRRRDRRVIEAQDALIDGLREHRRLLEERILLLRDDLDLW